jgi:thiamine kinase-like enzyme
LLKRILSIGLDLESSLNRNQRCISPSDFGFHNALLRDNGSLCFIDFEYAGWDDPAKAIGDFFSHPGVPVSREYFDLFVDHALQPYRDTIGELEVRVRLMEPVFKVKWCCIVLNEFLQSEARRRNFANPTNDIEQRKKIQLVKAQKIFNSIQF